MAMLTIFQIMGVSAAYLGVTLVLPWLLLRGKFAYLRTPARFMAYFMAGNFFCMNLVFLLQLLHISNRVTLIIGTLIPFLAVAVIKYKKSFPSELERRTERIRIVFEGEMGVKTIMLRVGNWIGKLSSGWLGEWLAPRWLDALLSLGVVGLVLYMYGTNMVNVYGYGASDVVVHNYWINSMKDNHIFVNGVYPFGFHCIMYYVHEVFSIPVYVLMRVFALTQTLMIHLMLLAFLKMVCKSKYTPYIGVVMFVASDIFYSETYLRYFSPLPQEYGMLFILPSVWFAIAFLQEKNFISRRSLLLFTISISMTLAVHFYDAMVAGVFCVGIAVGFWFRCLRWRYLKRLLLAGVTGILIAALPMVAAYAMGTPLQGSLNWGMSVISSDETKAEEETEQSAAYSSGEQGEAEVRERNPFQMIAEKFSGMQDAISYKILCYITDGDTVAVKIVQGSIMVLLLLGILCYILRRADYGAVLVTTGVFMVLFSCLLAADEIGIPRLMDASRCSIFFSYGIGLVWSLAPDALIYLLLRNKKAIDGGALAVLAASCGVIALTGIRHPARIGAYESNDAITCLTNILAENRDSDTWTICSANDERLMIYDKGYHYEMLDFLKEMESLEEDTVITLPSSVVYFFIEKKPIVYFDTDNPIKDAVVGSSVSEEWAMLPLSTKQGIKPYTGDDRWTTMSRMYYWAQAFQKLYPYEMEVYYESDEFVCYRIQQDEYSLYNFAIDYGYNK